MTITHFGTAARCGAGGGRAISARDLGQHRAGEVYFTDEPKTWGRYAKRVRENSLVCCASVAICDLSSRNPNVLFELGLRQAFDVPVLLVQEEGTPQAFDINPWRITNCRQSLRYFDVVEDRKKIIRGLQETEIDA